MRNSLLCSEWGKLGSIKSHITQKRLREEKIELYFKNPNKCMICGKNLSYEKRKNKFCSNSCSAIKSNMSRKVRKFCLNCSKELKHGWYKCCSKKCDKDLKWKIKFEKIKKFGIELSLSERCKSLTAKRFLKETRGEKCSICQGTEWMNKPIPLLLDHISGNPSDWSWENLRLVCGNCNMQLPTFAGRNKGHGRAYRRETYKKLGYC